MQADHAPDALMFSSETIQEMVHHIVFEKVNPSSHPDCISTEILGVHLDNAALKPGAVMPRLAIATVSSIVSLFRPLLSKPITNHICSTLIESADLCIRFSRSSLRKKSRVGHSLLFPLRQTSIPMKSPLDPRARRRRARLSATMRESSGRNMPTYYR